MAARSRSTIITLSHYCHSGLLDVVARRRHAVYIPTSPLDATIASGAGATQRATPLCGDCSCSTTAAGVLSFTSRGIP